MIGLLIERDKIEISAGLAGTLPVAAEELKYAVYDLKIGKMQQLGARRASVNRGLEDVEFSRDLIEFR